MIADDSSTSLIPDELVGATYYRIPKQSDELATKLFQTSIATAESGSDGSNLTLLIAPTRLRHGADHLFGREEELKAIDEAWSDPAKNILTFVAWGGVGKTSLVVEWMARKAAAGWAGFEYIFDWSFYSQGTREQGAASSDAFMAEALKFFGDAEMAGSAASAWDKGARLAQIIGERRTLLILDGIEPLQYPPGNPSAGQLKDPAMVALLKGLAQNNTGLCLVTTREQITDLSPFSRTVKVWDLNQLSTSAGVELLKSLGVRGTDDEFKRLVEDVEGHALTLNLLGRYLVKAHGGDIRRRDRVKLEKADSKIQGGHAFRAMEAYETWLAEGGEDGLRQIAVLRLLGLFDRPAGAGCIAALRKEPAIQGLTEPLIGLDEEDWNLAISSLEECHLVSRTTTSQSATPQSESDTGLDAHPLIREYFAKQMRENNLDGWRAAHKRLYEYLTESTEYRPDTLDRLQLLYQAVVHGCQAGLHQEAYVNVYRDRILRGTGTGGFYSWKMLGAFGADLGAVACFFEQPWSRLADGLSESDQGWLLNYAAFCLRALGRLTEALEPLRAALQMCIKQGQWKNAAIFAGNLSELELNLGKVADAEQDAKQSVDFADRSGDAFKQFDERTTLADAHHQAGRGAEALALFREAEAMQFKSEPGNLLLYSLRGYRYSDLLLTGPERAAWRTMLSFDFDQQKSTAELGEAEEPLKAVIAACLEVEKRAEQSLKLMTRQNWLLDIALDHLTLGRAALYRTIMRGNSKTEQAGTIKAARRELSFAVDGLRKAGLQQYVPLGLLSRAWLKFVDNDESGARADLEDAWQIAERGPMKLLMADICLYRARLFHDKEALAKARELIEECGYHRRDGELADATEAAKNW